MSSSSIIARLYEKKRLLETNNPLHKEIKTALIINGGAMRGAFAAGAVSALKELGLENIFDLIIALSSGTISAAYFLEGKAELASQIFSEDLATKKFIDIYKVNPKKIVGFEYINTILRQKRPINQQKIKNSRAQILFGVTDPQTGQEVYLDIKKPDIDIVDAIHASSAVPVLHPKPVKVHGATYLDGMIACGIPISPAQKAGATDIVIIENTLIGVPDLSNIPFLSQLLTLLKFKVTPQAKKAILNKKNRYLQTLQEVYALQKSGKNILIISPEKVTIGPLTINSQKLKVAAEQGKKRTLQLFS